MTRRAIAAGILGALLLFAWRLWVETTPGSPHDPSPLATRDASCVDVDARPLGA